jgi:hypothetical protein
MAYSEIGGTFRFCGPRCFTAAMANPVTIIAAAAAKTDRKNACTNPLERRNTKLKMLVNVLITIKPSTPPSPVGTSLLVGQHTRCLGQHNLPFPIHELRPTSTV